MCKVKSSRISPPSLYGKDLHKEVLTPFEPLHLFIFLWTKGEYEMKEYSSGRARRSIQGQVRRWAENLWYLLTWARVDLELMYRGNSDVRYSIVDGNMAMVKEANRTKVVVLNDG